MIRDIVREWDGSVWKTTLRDPAGGSGGGGGGGGLDFGVDNSGTWLDIATSAGEDGGLWGMTFNAVGGGIKLQSDTTLFASAPDMNIQTSTGGMSFTAHSSINMESTNSLISIVSNDSLTLSIAAGFSAVLKPDGSGGNQFQLKFGSTVLLEVDRTSGGVVSYHMKSGAAWATDL